MSRLLTESGLGLKKEMSKRSFKIANKQNLLHN